MAVLAAFKPVLGLEKGTLPLTVVVTKYPQKVSTPPKSPEPEAVEENIKKQRMGYIFMLLHGIQFAIQPILTKTFVSDKCAKVTLVLVCEVMKIAIALAFLLAQGKWTEATDGWTMRVAATGAFVPAAIYAVQNVLIQISYQHLGSLSFNLVNQSKMFFAALFLWILMGKKHSLQQYLCMGMIMLATVILGLGAGEEDGQHQSSPEYSFWSGFVPCAVASILSGVASAHSQRTLQTNQGQSQNIRLPTVSLQQRIDPLGTSGITGVVLGAPQGLPSKPKPEGRNAFLFSLELSTCSVAILMIPLIQRHFFESTQNHQLASFGIFSSAFAGFTPYTFLAPLVNALGGVVVGLVIKYCGSVLKSFATTGGLVLAGAFDFLFTGHAVGNQMLIAMPLVVVANIFYSRFPCKK
jgi:UDP-sugar transporter A1/2/3